MSKYIHIVGIAGKLMSGIARMAQQLGFRVTGCDKNIQSHIARELIQDGFELFEGYAEDQIKLKPDYFIIGNTCKRGLPLVEAIMNSGIPYYSSPEWLYREVLHNRWVISIAGTHGKTTTTSMVAWVLEYAGFNPGFMVGGQPHNFDTTSRITDSAFFVIESDEYDTAFFDKRPKFLHYRPKTLIFNNLEFDHADIYDDLAQIQQQFHYLIRTMPSQGQIIVPAGDENVAQVLQRGCWTPVVTFAATNQDNIFNANFYAKNISADGSQFDVYYQDAKVGQVHWELVGLHNVNNALACLAACRHAGIELSTAIEALHQFKGVAQRMEFKGEFKGVKIYDDFAHHPTAIATTLAGARAHWGKDSRVLAVVDFASYTMRNGVHQDTFANHPIFSDANQVFFLEPENCLWDVKAMAQNLPSAGVYKDLNQLANACATAAKPGDYLLVMTNLNSEAITLALKQQLLQ